MTSRYYSYNSSPLLRGSHSGGGGGDGGGEINNKKGYFFVIGPTSLLLLLVSSLHWRVYHHWRADTSNNILTSDQAAANWTSRPMEHFFIYQSFLYPKGNKAFSHQSNDTATAATTTLATLFVASKEQNFGNSFLYCIYQRGRPGLLTGSESFPLHYTSAPVRQALTFPIHPTPCRLSIFVALCDFLDGELPPEVNEKEKEEGDFSARIGKFALEFRSTPRGGKQEGRKYDNEIPGANLFIKQSQSSLHHGEATTTPLALVKRADTTPRQLVLCMSRMMAFENWRLVLTVLEVYRRLGVDLVVTHVLSAVSPLFALMRYYESAGGGGLLRMKPAVMFPMLRLGPGPRGVYDPNTDTEWTALLMSANECFYEYKGSASFIAVLDWDDMLVSGGNIFTSTCDGGATACEMLLPPSRSLPEAFHSALKRHPQAAFFGVERLQAASPSILRGENPQELDTTLEGFRTSLQTLFGVVWGGKIVAVPSRLHGVWIHDSMDIARPAVHTRVVLPATTALIVHVDGRVGDLNKAGVYSFNLTRWLGWKRFNETDLSRWQADDHFGKLVATLQKFVPSYTDKFNRCSVLFGLYFGLLQAEKRAPECLGFHLCGVQPQPGVMCVNAKNFYSHHRTGLSSLPVAHVRYASQLVETDQGCVVGVV